MLLTCVRKCPKTVPPGSWEQDLNLVFKIGSYLALSASYDLIVRNRMAQDLVRRNIYKGLTVEGLACLVPLTVLSSHHRSSDLSAWHLQNS